MEVKEIETIVPAKKVITKMYSCSYCGFQSYDQSRVSQHELEHSYINEKYIDDVGHAYLFESGKKAENYWDGVKNSLGDDYLGHGISFDLPGWYVIRWDEVPCGRGCCSKIQYKIEHISKTIAETEAYKKETVQEIDATLNALIGLSK